MRMKGRKRATGMNKLEADYSALLDQELAAGKILWRSQHEAIKVRLADNTFFTFDFMVLTADSELEIREVKGGWFPEHNRVKTKMAAELFPIPVVICRRPKKNAAWEYEAL